MATRDLTAFFDTLPPLQRTRAQQTLETQVRVNGVTFMSRHALIETRVDQGFTIKNTKHGRTLWNDDTGIFLDQRNATMTGLDYAAWLLDQPICSICRHRHRNDNRHPCE